MLSTIWLAPRAATVGKISTLVITKPQVTQNILKKLFWRYWLEWMVKTKIFGVVCKIWDLQTNKRTAWYPDEGTHRRHYSECPNYFPPTQNELDGKLCIWKVSRWVDIAPYRHDLLIIKFRAICVAWMTTQLSSRTVNGSMSRTVYFPLAVSPLFQSFPSWLGAHCVNEGSITWRNLRGCKVNIKQGWTIDSWTYY